MHREITKLWGGRMRGGRIWADLAQGDSYDDSFGVRQRTCVLAPQIPRRRPDPMGGYRRRENIGSHDHADG